MFVNFLNTSMLLSRGVFRGAMGAHPPPESVKYMLIFRWRGVGWLVGWLVLIQIQILDTLRTGKEWIKIRIQVIYLKFT